MISFPVDQSAENSWKHMTIIAKEIYELPLERRFIKISNVAEEEGNCSAPRHGPNIAIVLPTFNEQKNLQLLVPVIEEIFEKHDINGHLIIVDDNSRDGTAKIAIGLAKVYKNIVVIQRPGKLGLGSAYRQGIKRALEMGKDIIFEMDADLQHRPSYIPFFLKCLERTGAGLVIGSRYCNAGATRNWSFKRKLVSFSANFLTSIALGVKQTKDMTSGFRAYKAGVLEAIGYGDLTTNGYAWQIETLYLTRRSKHKIREIPIVFHEREIGHSKLGSGDVKEFMIFLVKATIGRFKNFLARKGLHAPPARRT